MVRWKKYIKAFLKLVRFRNLLIIAITMYLLRHLIIHPMLRNGGVSFQLTEFLFALLVLSTLCIAAAGYVINDYFDRKLDLINRPGKVILGRILGRRTGMMWHGILTALGILLGIYVSVAIGHLKFALVFIVVSGTLWFYSTTYKRQLVLGNIIVSILVGMVPLLVLLFEFPVFLDRNSLQLLSGLAYAQHVLIWIVGYSLFAFILTLIREIVKDVEDYEGDFAFGRQTIPIVWGVKAAKKIIISLVFITLLLLIFTLYKINWSLLTVGYVCVFIVFPLVVFVIKLIQSESKEDYRKASGMLKLIMLAGVLYAIVATKWMF